jgi:hypothetical protein
MLRPRALALVAALTAVLAEPAPAAGHAPYCGIRWGSTPERSGELVGQPELRDVRAGRHACFDRLVLDVGGDITTGGYAVRYTSAVREPGRGHVVPLRGGADLEITVGAPVYDADGRTVYDPADRHELVDVDRYRTFRQVAEAGSFEGQTVLGLGVRARLPFRVFILPGTGPYSGLRSGSRVVVDVAHRW